ncbi:major facilitator superfamily domain-containing protein [Ditylenchus destructor]|uniref:Major facilitator superfamily domain-containing protein n=1 Tax=Ditylenchus destructor TaxID=166010 RepID=A0AAD4MNY2_9BILA|nr:major facilitator superfamily domain-containing protein [Ditylenchus destructor]
METDHFILRRIRPKLRPVFVVTAAVILQFSYGLLFTFGNLLPYFVSYLRWKVNPTQSPGSMIWLQSLMFGLPGSALAGGLVEKKIGARLGIVIGSTVYTGFLAISYFAIQHSFPMLLISLGIFCTLGEEISYICVLVMSQKWLPNNVGLAGGLVTAGYAMGAFLVSPIQTKFINPKNLPADKDGFFTQIEILERVPKMFLLLAGIFAILQIAAITFIGNPRTTESTQERNSVTLDKHMSKKKTAAISLKEVVFSSTFAFLFLTLFLNSVWVQTISGLYKAFGQTFIDNDFFLAVINSLAAACNCSSRVIWGYLADRTSYKTTMSVPCALGAALMWSLIGIKIVANPLLYMLWVCLMYLCIGATYSLVPYATYRCFGGNHFGIAYGLIQLSLPLSGIVTALCSQFLLAIIHFEILFTIMAGTMFVSLLLTLSIRRTKYGKAI